MGFEVWIVGHAFVPSHSVAKLVLIWCFMLVTTAITSFFLFWYFLALNELWKANLQEKGDKFKIANDPTTDVLVSFMFSFFQCFMVQEPIVFIIIRILSDEMAVILDAIQGSLDELGIDITSIILCLI